MKPISEIKWKEGWKRHSIQACWHCNKIIDYCDISTVPSCKECLDLMERQNRTNQDDYTDRLMGVLS